MTDHLLNHIRKIEIKARGLSRHLFAGGYHSAFKGRGMSFSEVRPYQYGDDVRNIDWNVTARTNDPYIKVFEEEREMSVILMVDISGSAFFEGLNKSKRTFVAELCALLAFSADANQDKVGLLLYADKPIQFIPPDKGREHALRIIKALLEVPDAKSGTRLSTALEFMRNAVKKRSICFVISDFWDAGYEDALKSIARRHDCIGVSVWDVHERELPDVSMLQIADPEAPDQVLWIDTSDAIVRRAFTERFDQNQVKTTTAFRQCGADFVSLPTQTDYVKAMLQFFDARSKRR
jgi:uncharacterized protein (DUF58 family)